MLTGAGAGGREEVGEQVRADELAGVDAGMGAEWIGGQDEVDEPDEADGPDEVDGPGGVDGTDEAGAVEVKCSECRIGVGLWFERGRCNLSN